MMSAWLDIFTLPFRNNSWAQGNRGRRQIRSELRALLFFFAVLAGFIIGPVLILVGLARWMKARRYSRAKLVA
ncbi:MAG: hypothetical protein ABI183_02335, partial [Polyangiaceae bacterium]